MHAQVRFSLSIVAVALAACAVKGEYVWVDDYKAAVARPAEYVISPGDVIAVHVFNQDGMSAKARVRPDGKVSLPFLNDVEVQGYTPQVLALQLQTRLKDFIKTPVVTVSLEEERPLQVSVLGEVTRPGQYVVEIGSGVLQAVAASGGLTDYAHRDRIFVLRQEPKKDAPMRIRFRYDELAQATRKAMTFRLEPGDVVLVE